MTLENSPPQDFGQIELFPMSCVADSRVRMSALQETEAAFKPSAAAYGANTRDWLTKYDRASSSWKTRQVSFLSEWDEFSETWPRCGMMRSGSAFPLPPLAPITSESVSGLLRTLTKLGGSRISSAGGSHARAKWQRLLPTLTLRGNYNRKGSSPTSGDGLVTVLKTLLPTLCARGYRGGATPERTELMRQDSARGLDLPSELRQHFPETTGLINPSWAEGFMGFPIGWTDLNPSETASSPKSQK